MTERRLDILVIGAGPTGLVAAIEAARNGLSVRIVDRKPRRTTTSRALVVHARTLEVFERIGVSEAVRAAGVPFVALNVHPDATRSPVRVDLLGLRWGDTRYGFWLSIPQHETERCLEEHLRSLGVAVEWGRSFESLARVDGGVEARLRRPDGAIETLGARWLIGCDGGHSAVRAAAALGFARSSLHETFVLADARGTPGLPEDEGAAVLARDGVMFVVPMPEPTRWRIIAHVPGHARDEPIDIDAAFLDAMFDARLGVRFGAHDLTWTSQFVLKQGIAARYRDGRVFIAGDAAHLHSPVGGQGLNTGVQDAHALLWRIALVERAGAPCEPLLASYGVERRAIAQSMVKATTRATRLITLRNPMLRWARGRLARAALQTDRVQQRLGRGIGMLELRYDPSPITLPGPRGASGPGARLPDPSAGGRRLCELLDPLRHTVLILDDAPRGAELATRLRELGLPRVRVHAEPRPGAAGWADPEGALRASLGGARLVIVRPDRVVGATATGCDIEVVARYAARLAAPIEAL